MDHARPLPSFLIRRYHAWRATDFAENHSWYARLAEEGQRPRAMIIACCDSRVHIPSIFGAESGEFFIHRNIANLVPPYEQDGGHHGTSAAVEYAVTALHVAHIVVMGHSQCGGVQGYLDMADGKAPDLAAETSFVGRWMALLEPGAEGMAGDGAPDARREAMEKATVFTSLRNLMGFPFVRDAVLADNLSLHGIWHDIARGGLEVYDPASGGFQPV
jgi:carbonic anhydrase